MTPNPFAPFVGPFHASLTDTCEDTVYDAENQIALIVFGPPMDKPKRRHVAETICRLMNAEWERYQASLLVDSLDLTVLNEMPFTKDQIKRFLEWSAKQKENI